VPYGCRQSTRVGNHSVVSRRLYVIASVSAASAIDCVGVGERLRERLCERLRERLRLIASANE